MDISIYDYLILVKGYCSLQEQLHTALDAVVSLHDAVVEGYHFVPTRKSIREQIKHWPTHIPFVTSPASWVRPRQGRINHKSQIYQFTFHGAGLSFVGKQNRLDVGVRYCREGRLCITPGDVWQYLQTILDCARDIHCSKDCHLDLFGKLVNEGHLVRRAPLLPQDDQVYVTGNIAAYQVIGG